MSRLDLARRNESRQIVDKHLIGQVIDAMSSGR